MNDFEEKMKTTKQTLIIDKDFVKVKKETFDSMNNVISESKKVMELQPKLQYLMKLIVMLIAINHLKKKIKNIRKKLVS